MKRKLGLYFLIVFTGLSASCEKTNIEESIYLEKVQIQKKSSKRDETAPNFFSVANKIQNYISSQFSINLDDVLLESKLNDDLGLEDLDFLDVFIFCENEFLVEFHDYDKDKIVTVNDLVNFCHQNILDEVEINPPNPNPNPNPNIDPDDSHNEGSSGGGGRPKNPDDINSLTASERVAFANLEIEYRSRMGAEELAIYEKMSAKNKFAYLTNAKQAETAAKAKFSSSTLYNGKGDAFRHAYFHALNSITIGPELSKKLGDAHEIGAPPLEKQMDIFNNDVGRNYLQNSNVGESPQEFISRSLLGGGLRYLSPLGLNGVVIPNVTKLIATNK